MSRYFSLRYAIENSTIAFLEDIERFLVDKDITILFSEIEADDIHFFVESSGDLFSDQYVYDSYIPKISPYEESLEVDWNDQARRFSYVDEQGRINVEVNGLDSKQGIIYLKPTVAFGDPSQPTTRLMLDFLPQYVPHSLVIDIGTGSAILALSSICLGAHRAIGIEIDPASIEHAKENVLLNHMENVINIIDAAAISQIKYTQDAKVVIVCNMISSEQKIAFTQYKSLLQKADVLISSGILQEEKAQYVQFLQEYNFTVIDEKVSGNWIGLASVCKPI